MFKEQLLSFAMKAFSQAHEAKERFKNNLQSHAVKNYVRGFKDAAMWMIENRLEKSGVFKKSLNEDEKKNPSHGNEIIPLVKKQRKSSVKPAKEIISERADVILQMLKKEPIRLVEKDEIILGKKSLAYLVWALGHAELANLHEGISVHDISALLYQACKIELYPINISRIMHGNSELVRMTGQEKRTKTYLLTDDGQSLFKEKFL
jgi:hypothetical protein